MGLCRLWRVLGLLVLLMVMLAHSLLGHIYMGVGGGKRTNGKCYPEEMADG